MRGFVFFFFKQKTAYEMLRSLVGSEMCIRDRSIPFMRRNRQEATALGWLRTLPDELVRARPVLSLSLIHI